jgi:hypothetical protein
MIFCCCKQPCTMGVNEYIFPDYRSLNIKFIPITTINELETKKDQIKVFINLVYACYSPSSYRYYNSGILKEFIENGGIYMVHKEWDNCQTAYNIFHAGESRYRPELGCFPKNITAFDDHMSSIGCSITSGISTASVDRRYTIAPNAVNWKIFDKAPSNSFGGNATCELKGGTPLLLANTNSAINLCSSYIGYVDTPSLIPPNQNLATCVAEKIGDGLVIAFGDVNTVLSPYFYKNLCKYKAKELLEPIDTYPSESQNNPLP